MLGTNHIRTIQNILFHNTNHLFVKTCSEFLYQKIKGNIKPCETDKHTGDTANLINQILSWSTEHFNGLCWDSSNKEILAKHSKKIQNTLQGFISTKIVIQYSRINLNVLSPLLITHITGYVLDSKRDEYSLITDLQALIHPNDKVIGFRIAERLYASYKQYFPVTPSEYDEIRAINPILPLFAFLMWMEKVVEGESSSTLSKVKDRVISSLGENIMYMDII